MIKRAAVLLLAILLAAFSGAGAAVAEIPFFTDPPGNQGNGPHETDPLPQETSGDPFQFGRSVTYGEAFKFILLAVGVSASKAQSDQHWAYPYIQPALNNLLVLSFDEGDLDKTPTRLEVARMVAHALDFTDISGDSPYDDCDDGYVVKLYERGVMTGEVNGDGSRSFHPDAPVSQGELSAIVWRMMEPDLTEGMFYYYGSWVEVLEDVPKNPYAGRDLFVKGEKGRLNYTGGYYAQGIDISRYQGNIDWEAVAGDGIDFVFIRAGGRYYGRYGSGALYEDELFDQNMQGAIDAGLGVGAYFFSNAITVEEALAEADLLLSKLEPYREHVTYPIVCDWEYLGGDQGRTWGVDSMIITDCVAAFCDRIREAGYTPMLYFNKYCGYAKLDLRELGRYSFWLAEYNDDPSFLYDFQFWQYSDKGRVAGISGSVDMNLCFVPFGKGAD